MSLVASPCRSYVAAPRPMVASPQRRVAVTPQRQQAAAEPRSPGRLHQRAHTWVPDLIRTPGTPGAGTPVAPPPSFARLATTPAKQLRGPLLPRPASGAAVLPPRPTHGGSLALPTRSGSVSLRPAVAAPAAVQARPSPSKTVGRVVYAHTKPLAKERQPSCDSDRSTTASARSTAASDETGASAPTLAPVPNSVVIFDWDDTLFPTSWLTSGLSIDAEALREHGRLVERTLREARSHARVGIVSLSARPWVSLSAEQNLPDLNFTALLQELHINIYYAGEFGPEGATPPTTVEECRILKRNAMAFCFSELCGVDLQTLPLHALSIGDSIIEQEAVRELLSSWSLGGVLASTPVCKTVKFRDDPTLVELQEQLRQVNEEIRRLSASDCSFDVSMHPLWRLGSQLDASGL